jgi:tRNA A-37 threonylcarbamoyl transferase component Bud32
MQRFFKLFKEKDSVIKNGENWEKKYNKNINGLKSFQIMHLEHECLKRLENNYRCFCCLDNHFPKIVSVNWRKKTITMTDCGETVYNIREIDKIKPGDLPIMGIQISCILDNLRRNRIKHLDIHRNNICIKNGVIGLIDFNIAVIDDLPMSDDIKMRAKRYRDDELGVMMKRMIMM